MYGIVLEYGFPVMIGLVFVGFLWAWILTAVKPPQKMEDEQITGAVNPEWKYLDAGPEGVRRNIFEKIERPRKAVG